MQRKGKTLSSSLKRVFIVLDGVIHVFFVPQDGLMSGSADRRPALLPQQGGAASCDSRWGRQSVQPAHCAESTAGGKLKENDGYLYSFM